MAQRTRFLPPLALLVVTLPAAAQFEDPPAPNEEPSSYDTLFEQSDLGNVSQAARFAFSSGQRELQTAEKLAQKIAEAPADKRAHLEEKRQKALEGAAESFQEAIGYNAELLDAYTGLGTAFRKLGRYEEALQVHAKALQADAGRDGDVRGWAGSMLGLNMLGDATVAYERLSASRPGQAAILLDAMKEWLAEKQQDPGDLKPEDVQRMADWIAQHEGAAG
ncbi:MAG: hypothetical protein R2991_10500 [Thermoanaerobaculia bacterium]